MRFIWLVVPAAVSLLAFAACSSSSTPAADGAGTGTDASTKDSTIGDPTNGDSGTVPGSDSGTDTDSGSPMDSGVVPTTCMGPSGCTAAEVCCGTIPITGGTVPNCTTGAISTVCAAPGSCATKLGTTCSGTQTIRLCTKNSDCTEAADGQCCTFSGDDGGTLSFCANALVAGFGGGTCM